MFDHSEDMGEVAKAFVAAQSDVKNLLKSAENPHFRSQFVPLDAVVDHVREVFSTHGMAFIQANSYNENGICITTVAMHESGQWLSDGGLFMPADKNPQKFGSALTYARRYALMTFVGIAGDTDDDANIVSIQQTNTNDTAPLLAL
jgi:ERF superfamily